MGSPRSRTFPSVVLSLLVVSALPTSLAWAQTRSTLTGTVTDGTGAVLPGATVTLLSPDVVGGVQTETTNDRGVYRFSDLPPGIYQITASLSGFQTVERKGLRLPFGTTLTVDFSLVVGASEILTVEGKTPTVDVTTAQSSVAVDKDLVQSLPLYSNQRESNNAWELSPGSTYQAAFGGGGNNVMIDGTPATMSFGQSTNSVVISPTWLEQINVVALGAAAEYGEFAGVTANYVIRSGSNDFHGLLEYRTTRPSWMKDNTEGLPAAVRTRLSSTKIYSRWDTSAQVGGPILKDKLFFFGGMQYFYDETQAALTVAPATTKWPRYVGKVNWAVSKKVKAESMYSYSKSSFSNVAPNFTIDAGAITDQPGHIWSNRVTWTADPKTLWEFRTGGDHWIQDVAPRPPNTKAGPPPRRDAVTGISSGNTSQFRLQRAKRLSFGATVTRHVDRLAGEHVVKLGTEYEDQAFLTESGFPGGMSFVDRSGVPDMVTIWAGDSVEGIGHRTTFFAMDDWKVSSRVTLQPGLRFSFNRGSTPTTGKVFSTNTLSPRLGIAWELGKGHKTVARAHWGRFHASNATDVFDFVDTARRTPMITARVLPGGTFQELNRVTPAGNVAVDPDISHAYVDQFFVGLERELVANLSVKVQYIHKDYRNNYAFIDTRSVFTPVEQRDPGPDNVLGNADDGALMTVYALQNPGQAFLVQTNPEGADRKYDAFQVVAQKRLAKNWQVLASYTRSESRGKINNTNLAQAVGTAGIFANPNSAINASGRNGLDFPNQASLRAVYHANVLGGFNLSASYIYASGVGWSRTATFRLPQGNVQVRVAPRGTEPAAATSQLDFRFEKLIPLGGDRARALGVYTDVFNVFNKGFPPQTRYNEVSGATFAQPLNWVEGRAFKVAARVTF
jgi:hypothetical protein